MAMVLEKKASVIRLLTLLAGVALVLAACGGSAVEDSEENAPAVEGLPPTALELNGIWLQVEDPDWLGLLVRFSPDGTFAIDDEGDLARPTAMGRVELDDDTITFTSEGSEVCTEGDSWAWRASLPETGLLHIEHTEEAAGACRVPFGTEWTLTRLFPPSAAIREIAPAGPAEGPPPTPSDLAGIWIRVDPAGLLLRFGSDGTFAIDSHGAIDTGPGVLGTYELEQDVMTFTIGGGYACTAGGSFGWRVSLPQDGLLRIVHTREGSGNCLVPRGTEWTIVRVSPSSAASAEITAEEAAG